MNYLSEIPRELFYLILSYVDVDDFVEIFRCKDSEYNLLLNNKELILS